MMDVVKVNMATGSRVINQSCFYRLLNFTLRKTNLQHRIMTKPIMAQTNKPTRRQCIWTALVIYVVSSVMAWLALIVVNYKPNVYNCNTGQTAGTRTLFKCSEAATATDSAVDYISAALSSSKYSFKFDDARSIKRSQSLPLTVNNTLQVANYGSPRSYNGMSLTLLNSIITTGIWEHIIADWNVQSYLDIDCGQGYSTDWFIQHGIHARGVVPQSVPNSVLHDISVHQIVNDYAIKPFLPQRIFDVCWAGDFVRQVSSRERLNRISTWRKAAIIILPQTSPSLDNGYYRIQPLHQEWLHKLKTFGFEYDDVRTRHIREWADDETDKLALHNSHNSDSDLIVNAFWQNVLVYKNPSKEEVSWHLRVFGKEVDSVASNIMTDSSTTKIQQSLQRIDQKDTDTVQVQGQTTQEDVELQTTARTLHSWVMQVRYPPNPIVRNLRATNNSLLTMIVDRSFNNEMPTVPVVLWPSITNGTGNAETTHVFLDGTQQSSYLRVADSIFDFDPYVAWVADMNWGGMERYDWCQLLYAQVKIVKQKRIDSSLPSSWPVTIVDYSDYPHIDHCAGVEKELGNDYIKYFTRTKAMTRTWNDTTAWVDPGTSVQLEKFGDNYFHSPLFVRTDTVQMLEAQLLTMNSTLSDNIEEFERPIDVIHMWPLTDEGVSNRSALLRLKVSRILSRLSNETGWNLQIGLRGSAIREGRRQAQQQYTAALLESKIVIVTQRDVWEDHYRLFESLVHGALVFTDKMHGLPHGLKNGTSVVEFSSERSLIDLLHYYLARPKFRLAIAREGRRIAMAEHRSWHRMEEAVFEERLTKCSTPECPFVVNLASSNLNDKLQ